jgi:hypothetical protein
MKKLFLDFETFYDKGYTLSSAKMSTSEYVRDTRFKAHMVQWAFDDGPLQWASTESLQKLFDEWNWDEIELICHNTAFDGFILSHHYGKIPARYCDTMLLSRAHWGANVFHRLEEVAARLKLPGKIKGALEDTKGKRDLTEEELQQLADYGVQDVWIMREAYKHLYPKVPPAERDLIDLTLLMFCNPVLLVDLPRVEAELEREVGQKVAKVLRAGVRADQLSSADEFADLLREFGVEPPMKRSLTTGKMTYAFAKKDVEFLALRDKATGNLRDVIDARLAVKSTLGETRANRFLHAGENGWRLPVLLQYCGAHTTRWSAGNKMNMQNLPQKGELRKSILAPEGFVICTVDSAQIEARMNLWLAGDDEKLDIFRRYDRREGPDIYRVMASKIFQKAVADITDDERQLGKIVVLALGYGMGAQKLQETLATDKFNPRHLELSECQKIVNVYREFNEHICRLWKSMEQLMAFMILGGQGFDFKALRVEKEQMILPSGLAIHYNDITGFFNEWSGRYIDCHYRNQRGLPVKLYGGLLTENAVQALARCVVADQMLEIAKRYRVVMMTHDEISYIAPEREADAALDFGLQVMKTPPTWAPDLPVNAEGKYARYYSK